MNLTLFVWRQRDRDDRGRLVRYELSDISPDMSFLEMLDVLNEQLMEGGEEPIAFDHDCREGICGMCSLVINGIPHGPDAGTTVWIVEQDAFLRDPYDSLRSSHDFMRAALARF